MFDTIDYMLYEDTKEMTNELLSEFSPYMTARYLSFYDKEFITYTNETLNRYSSVFNTDEERFRFFENMIPKLKKKHVKYISKKKKYENIGEISN